MNTKIVAVAAVVVLLVAGGVGLAVANSNKNTDPEFTLGYCHMGGFESITYAFESGKVNVDGVNLNTYVGIDGVAIMNAVMSSKADMAILGYDPIINQSLNAENQKVKVVSAVAHPATSSTGMWFGYDKTTVGPYLKPVKYANGTDSEWINGIDGLVDADGTVKSGIKIALPYTGWVSSWLGYLDFLHEGGMLYGKEYAANQITDAQYNTLKNTKNDSIYVLTDIAACVSAFNSGECKFLICPANNITQAESANPEKFGHFLGLSSKISVMVAVASEKAIIDKYDSMVKVLQAIDIASAYCYSDSGKEAVCESAAWANYVGDVTEDNLGEYTAKVIKNLGNSWQDICIIKEQKAMFEKVAKLIGHEDYNADLIYNEELAVKVMWDVHHNGNFYVSKDNPNEWAEAPAKSTKTPKEILGA